MTVSEKDRKNWLTKPPAKPSGRKTATVVSVLRGDRAGDLARTLDHGRQPIVAERPVAIDVLEHDDRVVDDASDRDRETAEREDVQRDAARSA